MKSALNTNNLTSAFLLSPMCYEFAKNLVGDVNNSSKKVRIMVSFLIFESLKGGNNFVGKSFFKHRFLKGFCVIFTYVT